MNITQLDLTSTKVFLSTEGEALLSPLLYILASLHGTYDCKEVLNLQNKYQKYSITHLHGEKTDNFSTRGQLLGLLMEMTGNLRV